MSEDPRQTWRTPYGLWLGLHTAVGYTIDCAADERTSQLGRWLGPGSDIAEDALGHTLDWRERGWLNPPFADPMPWVRWVIEQRAPVDMLVPCSPGTRWWQAAVRSARMWWTFDARVAYEAPPGIPSSAPAFDSCLFRFDGEASEQLTLAEYAGTLRRDDGAPVVGRFP